MDIEKLIQQAFTYYQTGNIDEAEKTCNQILKKYPNNTNVLHLLGLIYFQLQNYDLAIKKLRKVIRLNPNDADAHYDLGNVLQEKGLLTKAITHYRKAIKLNPKYVDAYNNLGTAFYDNLKHDTAIKFYKQAIQIDPNCASAYNNLGIAFQEKQQLDEAITHFQRALVLKQDYADAYYNLDEAVQGKGYEKKSKTNKKNIYAIYKCLYGEDYIQESIKSIDDHVDKIFVFWDDTPWGNITECSYEGKPLKFPKKFDAVVEKIKALKNSKIELIYDHQVTKYNQLTHYINDIILPNHERPTTVLFLKAEHVFRRDQIEKTFIEFKEKRYVFATTKQIEVWKGLKYRIPDRPYKTGAILCNFDKLDKMPVTFNHGGTLVMPVLSSFVHNLGFAISEKIMYWKHLINIAFAQQTGSDASSKSWYEEKWLKWDYKYNNKNLEPLKGYENQIPEVIPYDINELPELIKERYFPEQI